MAKSSKSLVAERWLGLARGLLYGAAVGRPTTARSAWASGRRSFFVVVCALLVPACISPTLPPGDPPRPAVELGEGVVVLRGAVPQWPSSVFAQNNRTGLIFGQETLDGSYDFTVEAQPCDDLDLWYTTGVFRSSPLRFVPAALTDPPLSRSICFGATPPAEAEPDAGAAPSRDAGTE
jgi:hypothetical protein